MKLVLNSQDPEKDIEAIARSRINRAEGSRQMSFWGGGMVLMGAGLFAVRYSQLAGWGLSIVGFLILLWYLNDIEKRQKVYKFQLLDEWEKNKTIETKVTITDQNKAVREGD